MEKTSEEIEALLKKEYTTEYLRISDGRKFLCRNITPKDCRLYDTVEKTFVSMNTTKRSKLFKSVLGRTYHRAKRQTVVSAKVRELRKEGHEVIGGTGDW